MPSSRPISVFLADDSAAIRSRVAEMLRDAGMEVVGEGVTPKSCVDAILAGRPDVVVLDIQLEGGTGLQVMEAVHSSLPGVAFVVFSNNSGPAYRARYLRKGAVSFLDKSGQFGQLAHAVASACGRSIH